MSRFQGNAGCMLKTKKRPAKLVAGVEMIEIDSEGAGLLTAIKWIDIIWLS